LGSRRSGSEVVVAASSYRSQAEITQALTVARSGYGGSADKRVALARRASQAHRTRGIGIVIGSTEAGRPDGLARFSTGTLVFELAARPR
jgi:hypothetical protein